MVLAFPDEVVTSPNGIDEYGSRAYEYPLKNIDELPIEQEISTGSTPWICTPRGVQSICLVAEEVSGSATFAVEVTSNKYSELKAGTEVAVSLGSITATTRYELKPYAAVRLTIVSGTGVAKLHYRAQ